MTGRRCPGCRRSIAHTLYACGLCWRLLPTPLRHAISETYIARKAGESGAGKRHEEAKKRGDAWLAEHYGRV